MKRQFFISIFIILSTLMFSQERFRSGIFLHHSTGDYIWGNDQTGNTTDIPAEINKYNSENNYSDDQAFSLKEKWFPNSTDNEWNYWRKVFNKEVNDDIYSIINSNKIVIIKSCFPSSEVEGWGEPADTLDPSKKTVYNYKWHWRYFLDSIKAHPETFFVIWTNAPKVNGYDHWAKWSNQFCTWAKDTLAKGKDPEYVDIPKNVYVFDYFHKLVGDDYKLKPEYAAGSSDSHPNGAATDLIAPQFVKEIFDAAAAYEKYYNDGLQPPVLKDPENNSAGLLPEVTFNWKSAWGAGAYYLQVSDDPDFRDVLTEEEIKDTTFHLADGLSDNSTYYWRVRSLDQKTESQWTDEWSFSTATPTKINPVSNVDKFDIYPNPTHGNINIRTTGDFFRFSVRIYNVIGQLVKEMEIHLNGGKTFSIDLSSLPKGQYFLSMMVENEIITKKIIIT
jgi:hypothetical protein